MSFVLAFFDTSLGRYVLMAAVAIAAAVAFGAHERAIGYKEAVDAYAIQEKKRDDAYLALMARRQTAFSALEKKYSELSAQHDRELVAKDGQRMAELAALKKRIPTYVTKASTRSCPDVPRSYLLFRADAAAFANRQASAIAPAAAAASGDAAQTASGISLDDLSGADADQAGSYRACAERDEAWLKYKADVEAYVADVQRVLKDGSS
jgi:hypothetical protein